MPSRWALLEAEPVRAVSHQPRVCWPAPGPASVRGTRAADPGATVSGVHRSGDGAGLIGPDRVRAGAAVEADQQELRQVAGAVRVVGKGPLETNAGRPGVGQEEGLELRRAGAPEQLAGLGPTPPSCPS